jgi:hypothetical protein
LIAREKIIYGRTESAGLFMTQVACLWQKTCASGEDEIGQ